MVLEQARQGGVLDVIRLQIEIEQRQEPLRAGIEVIQVGVRNPISPRRARGIALPQRRLEQVLLVGGGLPDAADRFTRPKHAVQLRVIGMIISRNTPEKGMDAVTVHGRQPELPRQLDPKSYRHLEGVMSAALRAVWIRALA